MTLPALVEQDVRRILRGAAQRLLDELERDTPDATARRNGHTRNGGLDKRPLLINGKALPIGAGADRQSRAEAA